MNEFEKGNAEVFGLVKDGQQLPRVTCRFVPEVDYHRYKRLEREAAEAAALAEQNAWKAKVLHIATAVSRAGCGVIFIGGAMEGLMDPTFAAVLTGICVVWSAVGFLWGRNHG